MADNTVLSTSVGSGDTIRNKDRTTAKTQIVGLDIGIGGTEVLMTVGQKAMAASIPVVLPSDQSAIPVTGTFFQATQPTSDAGPAQTMSFGVSAATFTSANATAEVAVTSAPTAGQKLVITDLEISVDTAMTLTFKCETTGVIVGKYFLPANSTMQITPRGKKKLATADKKLTVTASVAGNVAITAHYYSEA